MVVIFYTQSHSHNCMNTDTVHHNKCAVPQDTRNK